MAKIGRNLAAAGLALWAMVALASCATTPKVPGWVFSTPPADGSNTYFVGSASGGDMGTVTSDATSNLIAGIMQYMGVSVKVNTSATAQASLTEYSANLRQTVETQATNRLSGFKVLEKYVQRDKTTGRTTVYILASYATLDLNKEKSRIAALFQEKIDAVAKPEAEGDAFAASGQALAAVGKYIEAMAAASGSDIENADLKVERNANKARSQLAQLGFSFGGTAELKASLGLAPLDPVVIQLFAARSGSRYPVPGANLLVSYPRKLPNGRTGTKTESLVTDESGNVRLSLPPPDFVGKGNIVVQLDLSSAMELLDGVGKKYLALVSAVDDEIGSKTASLPYVVSSSAASVPLTLFIVDFDANGAISPLDSMETGLMEALSREGFQVSQLTINPSLINAPLETILATSRLAMPGGTGRFAYGTARVNETRKEGAFFVASVSGSLKIVDLATGKLLYAGDKSWQALASDQAGAQRNALRELGSQVFGKEILSSLP